MKSSLVLLLALAAVCVADDKYTTRFDNVDVDAILKNERILKNYLNCLLRDGRCTPDAAELKRLLADALATNCEKCSEKQKSGAEKVISHLAKNRGQDWNELLAKYDKENVYRTKFADQAKKLGVPL